MKVFGPEFFLLFNTLVGCLIFGFMIWQGWLLARWLYLSLFRLKDAPKFPVLPFLILIFCCGFYGLAYIFSQ